jgi:hypothetical protein
MTRSYILTGFALFLLSGPMACEQDPGDPELVVSSAEQQLATCVPDGSIIDTLGGWSCCSGYVMPGTKVCSNPADVATGGPSCRQICGTPLVNSCVPTGGWDDTLSLTTCCSGAAVSGSTWCLDPADWGTDWKSCVQKCAAPPPQPFCGDGVCNGGETCETCADCGSCQPCCPPGSTCLAGDTPVTMADGSSKPISDVVTGDRVLSYQPEMGVFLAGDVTQTFRHPDAEGTVLVNGSLRATPNHPFFVAGVWKRADELVVGDVLTQLDAGSGGSVRMMAEPVRVERLEMVSGRLTTYNLEVAGAHDYFAAGYLVHNKNCRVCAPQ